MDNNGIDDFFFLKYSGTYLWSSGSGWTELRRLNFIIIDPLSGANQVAGRSFSTPYFYYDYWPYALSEGYIINSDLDFNTYGFTIASRIDPLPIGGGVMHAGYWWPSIEDHYLGVHFIDTDSNYHYGWIRCSVLDSAEVLIIKDYAYETEIEHPIVAGDTVSYVGINEIENTLHASVYSFGKNIYLHLDAFTKSQVMISDLNGKVLITEDMERSNQIIDMSKYASGIYLVTILQGDKQFNKRVFIG
jgi:hypothetical protein